MTLVNCVKHGIQFGIACPRCEASDSLAQGHREVSGSDGGKYYDIVVNGVTVSCNDVIDALGLNFNRGEAFKALWRCGRKPGVSEKYDLDKAACPSSEHLAQIAA